MYHKNFSATPLSLSSKTSSLLAFLPIFTQAPIILNQKVLNILEHQRCPDPESGPLSKIEAPIGFTKKEILKPENGGDEKWDPSYKKFIDAILHHVEENVADHGKKPMDSRLSETEEFSGKRKRGPPKRVIIDLETPTEENSKKRTFASDGLSRKGRDYHKIPGPVDGSCNGKKPPLTNVEPSIEKEPETGIGSSALKNKASIDPLDIQQTLPFMKNQLIWKTIESMEVFQKIPQKPHFKPLEHYKENLHEGLAIGHMLTFSRVVEIFSKEAKSITSDDLETLAELEKHGFDVVIVRDCVNKLLTVKDKKGKLIDEVNELNHQILLQNGENSRIEKEIFELKEKLLHAESAKRKGDDRIASLMTTMAKSEEMIRNVDDEFEGIASSML